MTTKVKIAELRNNLSKYVRAAENGEEIVILDRNRPIARIVPAKKPRLTIRPAKRPFKEIRDKRYERIDLGYDVVDLLIEDRRKR